MYRFACFVSGVAIAVMVAINGNLTGYYGVYTATVIIHLAGLLFLFLALKARRQRLFPACKIPAWMYLGGVIGILTTLFNNFAFGKISMTGLVALSLFGETVTALTIDVTGLFGMQKRRMKPRVLVGLVFSLAGILLMLRQARGAALYAVLVSIGAGVTVVLSRTVNARLSGYTGEMRSSFINHLTGLGASGLVLALAGRSELAALSALPQAPWWAYSGGVMGALVVMLCNATVPRVPAFEVTLLTFVGQVFTGIGIDVLARRSWSSDTFIGGLLIAAGIAVNLLWERAAAAKSEKAKTRTGD